MTFELAKLGDWVCYDNDENKLQAHNATHKKAKIEKPTTLPAKIKRFFNSLFHKSQASTTHTDNDVDKWTCHRRTLMRYTSPPLDIQDNVTGGVSYARENTMALAENRKQHYSTSTTLIDGDHGPARCLGDTGVRGYVNLSGGPRLVAPPIPDRSTLRMVTPTIPPYVHITHDNMM